MRVGARSVAQRNRRNREKASRSTTGPRLPTPDTDMPRDDLLQEICNTPASRYSKKRVSGPMDAQNKTKKARMDSEVEGQDADKLDEDTPKYIRFDIPRYDSQSYRTRMVLTIDDFEDVRDHIYETLGCKEIKRKPEIIYKLTSRGTQFIFESKTSWEDIKNAHGKLDGSKRQLDFKVQIVIDTNYMKNLKFTLAEAKKSAKRLKARQKNINAESEYELSWRSGSEDETAVGGFERESVKEKWNELRKVLSQCARCGPEKPCKVDQSGEHVRLTFAQLRSWALGIMDGSCTTKLPPKTQQFAMFYASRHIQAAAPPPQVGNAIGPADESLRSTIEFLQSIGVVPQIQKPSACAPALSATGTILATCALQKSGISLDSNSSSQSVTEASLIPYPEICAFIDRLHGLQPARKLGSKRSEFLDNGYIYINEISSMQLEEYTGVHGFNAGQAKYLKAAIDKEVRQVKRERRTARSSNLENL